VLTFPKEEEDTGFMTCLLLLLVLLLEEWQVAIQFQEVKSTNQWWMSLECSFDGYHPHQPMSFQRLHGG
jgi:hypothetical protein